MANIYDVAKEAGVSIATVSAVINGSAYVSPKLKRRVISAIEKLDYHPNLMARGLAKRQSHTLGMVVTDISNPFFPAVIRGAEDEAREHGYNLLVASSDDDPRQERMYLELFLAKRVDGILLTKAPGKLPEGIVAKLKSSATPLVQVMRVISGYKSDAVLADDQGAAFQAVSHLLRLNYRRIGMITGVKGVSTTRQRIKGYRQALKEWGLKTDRSLITRGDFRLESGYLAGVDLLRRKPEAVFVSNYMMTVGFMRALYQYQLRCPQDVAVVTCDDYPWLDSFSPRLTTVDFQKYKLGTQAAKSLIRRIKSPEGAAETIQMKNRMFIRESCGIGLAGHSEEAVSKAGESG
ncbi:MAG TPA: LacI family DNA-binding transcriptional regulator [Acidobacteriota bacterium]|nr:LacI family DNA-binding transcriptional regulator [Acidobacteriota bacterium]